jgi:5-methylcytosine-specific restriction endonuclease McrA
MPTLYARNAAALRAETRERRLPCARCGLDFDWSAPARSRWAFSAGHIIARSLGGSDERSNLRPEHYGCNAAAGNGLTRGAGSHNGIRPPQNGPSENRHSERWP